MVDYLCLGRHVPRRLLTWLFFREPPFRAWSRASNSELPDAPHAVRRAPQVAASQRAARIWQEEPILAGRFEKVVFILSTGRTGTMALARYFNTCYEQVKAVHEPRPSWRLRIVSNRYLCGRLSKERLVRALVKHRRKSLGKVRQLIYIEANNFLHGFLDAFDDVFENPLIVHLVRDPRTFIRSWINFGVFQRLKGLVGRFHRSWLLKPGAYEENPTKLWKEMRPAERLAWYWNAINRELDRGKELFGERYLRVRFEDLFAEGGSQLVQLARWIGLPETPCLLEQLRKGKVNASPDRGFPSWEDWDTDLKRRVLKLCGPLMIHYGYGRDRPDRPGEARAQNT